MEEVTTAQEECRAEGGGEGEQQGPGWELLAVKISWR